MHKFIFKAIVAGGLIVLSLNGFAQKAEQEAAKKTTLEAYDPLIPQLFAFDKESQIFAGINNVNNTIDIISYENDNLEIKGTYLVDVFQKRHDVTHIYRPQSVAIYQGKIVFLASQIDSCYIAVLDVNGNLQFKQTFQGDARAFSYSPEAQELYIGGEHQLGYDLIVLNTENGIENMTETSAIHYQRPRKSEEIIIADPYGIGMTAIAVSVVFLSLIALYLCFKYLGRFLLSVQNRKAKKAAAKEAIDSGANSTVLPTNLSDISGEEFAAIAAAIYMYNSELHDDENTVLTINKIARSYSPWNSKIYGLNTYFNKR